jgi:pimeloyl-ACP methyl ester carboxylesterase
MGAGTALAAVAVLGDGATGGPETEPDRPTGPTPAPRPRVVAIVADSASSELPIPIAGRLPLPILRRQVADLLFAGAARRVGEDLRATEPIRIVGLVEPVPVLFIHGDADTTTPVADARRLASAAGPSAELWTVPGAEHSRAHATEPLAYEHRVTAFLRSHFADARDDVPIIATQMAPAPDDRS